MHNLTNNELKQIKGGGISVGAGLLIAAGVVFVIGVIDGLMNPKKCNN